MSNVLTKSAMYGDVEWLSHIYSGIKNNTYFVITGDTDSIFLALQDLVTEKGEPVSQVLEICQKAEDYLNNQIVPRVVKKHRPDLDHTRLRLKNELVCKRGLFVCKKRYALHIILNEGEEVDEIFIRGIETRRSDYPSLTKKYLKTLLDMILIPDEISFVEILDFVDEKRKEFIKKSKQGLREVAKPSSFGKELSKYKTIPQNVISMLNWNSLMYESFFPGTRGYLFKLLGLDKTLAPREVVDKYIEHFESLGKKLEVVSIPVDEPKLPEWFIPNIKEMVRFAWDDRCNMLIEPVGFKKQNELITWED